MDRNLMADILEQVADFLEKANTERKYEWVLPHWAVSTALRKLSAELNLLKAL